MKHASLPLHWLSLTTLMGVMRASGNHAIGAGTMGFWVRLLPKIIIT